MTVVDKYRDRNPLILFSGDIFSPAPMSFAFKGRQMIPFLDRLGVHVACVGNHDLDFGPDRFRELVEELNFPWLLTNIHWVEGMQKLDGTKEYHI